MFRRLVCLLILGTVAFLLTWAVARFGGWFQVHDIRVIFVNGNGSDRKGYVSPADVKNLTDIRNGYNILKLDLDRVRSLLKRQDWIKDAWIKISLFKGVVEIYIEERKPVGRVEDKGGEGYLVDAEGVILGAATEGNPTLKGLPFSPEAGRVPRWAAELLDHYRDFSRCVAVFPIIDVSDPECVMLFSQKKDYPLVKLGALDDFWSFLPKLEELLLRVDVSGFATIDCRLGDGCVLKPRVEGGRESG